jgi:hypothetical protein
LVHTIQAHGKGSVRGLYYDPIKNYLFSANYDDGTIAIIDLQKPGKEKYAAVTAMFHGKKDVRTSLNFDFLGQMHSLVSRKIRIVLGR